MKLMVVYGMTWLWGSEGVVGKMRPVKKEVKMR